MSRRSRRMQRPTPVEKIQEVFSPNVEEPLSYYIRALSDRGTRVQIVNWDGVPRLTVSRYTPNGWRNVFTARLTIEGIERAEELLKLITKALEGIKKLDEKGIIKIQHDPLFVRTPESVSEEEKVFLE